MTRIGATATALGTIMCFCGLLGLPVTTLVIYEFFVNSRHYASDLAWVFPAATISLPIGALLLVVGHAAGNICPQPASMGQTTISRPR